MVLTVEGNVQGPCRGPPGSPGLAWAQGSPGRVGAQDSPSLPLQVLQTRNPETQVLEQKSLTLQLLKG